MSGEPALSCTINRAYYTQEGTVGGAEASPCPQASLPRLWTPGPVPPGTPPGFSHCNGISAGPRKPAPASAASLVLGTHAAIIFYRLFSIFLQGRGQGQQCSDLGAAQALQTRRPHLEGSCVARSQTSGPGMQEALGNGQ